MCGHGRWGWVRARAKRRQQEASSKRKLGKTAQGPSVRRSCQAGKERLQLDRQERLRLEASNTARQALQCTATAGWHRLHKFQWQ